MVTNIVDLFEQGSLTKCPEKVAFIEGSRSINFREVEKISKLIATVIINKRVSINCCIAVVLKQGIDILISDLAVLYSGNFYSNIDIKSPQKRLNLIFDNLKPKLFITSNECIGLLKAINVPDDQIINIDTIDMNITVDDDLIKSCYKKIIDTDPSCVINTSGSTGIPKSCILNHRGIIDYVFWSFNVMDFTGDEISGVIPAFYFDGYFTAFFNCIYNGATFVIVPDSIVSFPIKLAEYLQKHNISFVFWVPSVLVTFVTADILTKMNLSSLRTICFAGEVFNTAHFNYWKKNIPNAKYINLYGPIEISVICTYYIVDREFKDDEPLPIGFPCSNTDIILLKEDNKLAERGEQGEICVRGSSLALGYYNDSEKTSDAFVQNPLNPHYPELIYRTGDLGYCNENNELIFVGRKDYQIKHMGYRLELGEIEHLASAIKEIKHVCILYNNAKREITIFYSAEKELTAGFIRTELGRSLPKYALPTKFIFMEDLPKNPNGKIDRQELNKIMIEENNEI